MKSEQEIRAILENEDWFCEMKEIEKEVICAIISKREKKSLKIDFSFKKELTFLN